MKRPSDAIPQSVPALEEAYCDLLPTSVTSLTDMLERLENEQNSLLESSRRWAEAIGIVSEELPKRGWYLSGKEPSTLIPKLASYAKANDWKSLDEAIMAHVSAAEINVGLLAKWLAQKSVPDYCINRIRILFEQYHAKQDELVTVFGVPLMDELCRYLYDKKDFTTKRGKQPKPKIACKTASSPDLVRYYERFVEQFGSLHEDVDPKRLSDEDYFNRSAIVHGQMQRSFGPKDSAKTVMALLFLVFACQDANVDLQAEQSTESTDEQ